MVTGAGGCIGGALAETLARFEPRHLLLVDMSEQGVYELQRQFERAVDAGSITVVLGNICERSLLADLLERCKPQIIFHAAAFKHVPLLEQNPFAAIANNSIGTARLAQLAANHGCEQVILVSTDKAADPASIMGASKRIAELALLTLHESDSKTRMRSVRLGNVLNSPGSIVPLFTEQIAGGRPITITHPEVKRYFITVEEAVSSLLDAASHEHENTILVPRMTDPVRVVDVARYMFSSTHPEREVKPEIMYIGLRPGDKLMETLIGVNEKWSDQLMREGDDRALRGIASRCPPFEVLQNALGELEQAVHDRDLKKLLDTVIRIVPEYQPSAVIAALRNSQPLPMEVPQ